MAEGSKQPNVTVEMDTEKQQPSAGQTRGLTRFQEMERDVERLLDQFFQGGFGLPFRREWPAPRWPTEGKSPSVDVIERDDEILVRAELPGVDRKDLDVSLTDNGVTIKAASRKQSREEQGEYYRQEISSGYLQRTIGLPGGIDANACKAQFKDGLLELRIPKQQKAKRIQVDVK